MSRKLTVQLLEESDDLYAVVWRFLKAGPFTVKEVAESLGCSTHQVDTRVKSLSHRGWIHCKSGSGNRFDQFRWLAVENKTLIATETPGQVMKMARRRLSGIQKRAHEARFTGLASSMARALEEIEKESVQIRDGLRCP